MSGIFGIFCSLLVTWMQVFNRLRAGLSMHPGEKPGFLRQCLQKSFKTIARNTIFAKGAGI